MINDRDGGLKCFQVLTSNDLKKGLLLDSKYFRGHCSDDIII
jgi:hypothetical protein